MSLGFRAALEAAGLMPGEIVADGRIRRCRTEGKRTKRNGWFVLHPDGHGIYGDWTTGSSDPLGTWRDEQHQAAPSAAITEQMRRRRERERESRVVAMKAARAFWRGCMPFAMPHPYLTGKGLSSTGCAGIRMRDGKLVIPVWNGDWMVSLQTIDADGQKRFWPGAPVKAGCYVMDRPRAALTAFCEGFATGLAVLQSVRQARVVVCFDAGNLSPVIERMRPTGSVVIAADNDWRTAERIGTNPGLEKARNAAELIGCGVAYPTGIEGSDFCDMKKELGANAEKRIEREVLAAARYVTSTRPEPVS